MLYLAESVPRLLELNKYMPNVITKKTATLFDIQGGREVLLKSEVPSLGKGIPLGYSVCFKRDYGFGEGTHDFEWTTRTFQVVN